MTEDSQDLLAILIISNKNFADAYQLCKVLSWKFGIIGCSSIIDRIHEKGYVTVSFPVSNTLKYFALTSAGEKRLREEKSGFVEYLKGEFPAEVEFVSALGR
jgi:hypothetical protein